MVRETTLLIAVLALAAGVCPAQDEKQERPFITVSGASEVRVAPDQVELRVGVQARSEDVGAMVEQQRLQIKRAIALALKHGVEEKNIQTAYLRIDPFREERSGGFGWRDYYYVHRDLTITLTPPAQFDALLSELIQSGVNVVSRVQFKTTQLRKYKDQARAQALAAAQEKAAAMAGRLGRKIGKVYSIEEEDADAARACWGQSASFTNSFTQAPGGGAAQGALALGQIGVEARVKVRFELQ